MQDVRSRTEPEATVSSSAELALETISIIGAVLSITGAVLTIITLLIFRSVLLTVRHASNQNLPLYHLDVSFSFAANYENVMLQSSMYSSVLQSSA